MEELTIEDYLISAKNFYQFMGIQPGQQVLLLPTLEFLNGDPLAVEALKQVGKEHGAEISVALVESYGIRGNPPLPIVRAIESSDVFFAMGDKIANPVTGHCLTALRARWDYGAKQADLEGGRGILAAECSKFPVEVFLAIGRSILAKLNRGEKIAIVDENGTNLSFTYKPWDIYGGGSLKTDHLEPGQRNSWPLGNIVILPGDSCSGVAMVECIRKVHKIFEKPIKFVIENCRVVEIEEREETAGLREEWTKPGNSNFVEKFLIGLNPKGSISKGIHRSNFGELIHAAGVIRISIGDRPGYVASDFSTSGFLLRPTIILDGEVLFDHGRPKAFDDPQVKEAASKYGDPDQFLAMNP